MLASLGIRPQMLSWSGAEGNSGVVWPQPGQIWPLMFSTPATSVLDPAALRRGVRWASSRRASWCAMTCGVATTSTYSARPDRAKTNVGPVQVGVDQAGPLPLGGQGQGEVHRDRCLADAALPARDRDDRHLFRAVRHEPLSGCGDPGEPSSKAEDLFKNSFEGFCW